MVHPAIIDNTDKAKLVTAVQGEDVGAFTTAFNEFRNATNSKDYPSLLSIRLTYLTLPDGTFVINYINTHYETCSANQRNIFDTYRQHVGKTLMSSSPSSPASSPETTTPPHSENTRDHSFSPFTLTNHKYNDDQSADPLHFQTHTKIGFAIGACISIALVIIAYTGTEEGDALNTFFHDIAQTICQNVFETTSETPKTPVALAQTGLFTLFGFGFSMACAGVAKLSKELGDYSSPSSLSR